MTKQWYIEFRRDQSRDMMELYYAYYKMKGGSLPRFDFDKTFPRWVVFTLGMGGFRDLQYFIFRTLDTHFVV